MYAEALEDLSESQTRELLEILKRLEGSSETSEEAPREEVEDDSEEGSIEVIEKEN